VIRGLTATTLAFVAAAVVGCSAPVPTPLPRLLETPAGSLPLETPVSDLPAAGICDLQSGDVATFHLAIDVPQPRCGKVLPTQRLRVINDTPATVTVTFAGVVYELPPRAQVTFARAFGTVWEPGVHDLQTSAATGGSEILLIENLVR